MPASIRDSGLLLQYFVALWMGILEAWTGEKNLSCSRADLHHLLAELQGWFELATMFQRKPAAPTTAAKPVAVQPQVSVKEAKLGGGVQGQIGAR